MYVHMIYIANKCTNINEAFKNFLRIFFDREKIFRL